MDSHFNQAEKQACEACIFLLFLRGPSDQGLSAQDQGSFQQRCRSFTSESIYTHAFKLTLNVLPDRLASQLQEAQTPTSILYAALYFSFFLFLFSFVLPRSFFGI